MAPRTRPLRKARKTLLIVGEGWHEAAFLNHIKQLYAPRGCGTTVTIKNAKGKGAKHVVKYAISQTRNTEYDRLSAMLDTDTDWDAGVARLARVNDIRLLKSEPCFDALMLRVLGMRPRGMTGDALKKELRPYLADEPTVRQAYEVKFTREVLEAARSREPTINELLKIFEWANGGV